MRTPISRLGAVAAVAVLLLASACADDGGGGGDEDFAELDGQEIADAAKEDMLALDSMTYAGDLDSGGTQLSLDVSASAEGACSGTLELAGGVVEVLATSDGAWFRADEAFWRANAPDTADQIIAAVGDKWVVDSNDEFSQFCDLDEFRNSLFEEEDGSETTYTNKGADEIDGDAVVEVESKDDEGTSTGYVLVEGEHYLVKIERTTGANTGTVTFSGFNEDVAAETPADDEAVDLNAL
jgi:hypothetical protein